MTTGLDVIERDKKLQNHWMLRVVAYLIDFLIIYTPFWVANLMINLWKSNIAFTLVAGVVMVIYATVMEASSGETIGKRFVSLKTTSAMGPLDTQKTAVRNLSKIFPVVVLLDVIFGLITTGDPRHKYSDRVAGTTVVETAHLYDVPPPPSPYAVPSGQTSPEYQHTPKEGSYPSGDDDTWEKS